MFEPFVFRKGSCKKWSPGFGGSLIWGRDQCSLDTSGANLIRRQMEQGITVSIIISSASLSLASDLEVDFS